jgi:hypothetical protein
MRMRVLNADSIIATVFILAAAVGMIYLRETMQHRIVPDGPGALMAADADGLRELHVLYSSPKICGEIQFQKSTDFMMVRRLCNKVVPITPATVKKGLMLLPGGTRGVSLRTGYILTGGYVAASSYSPININEMVKDGAVKVEYIQISEPNHNAKGWVVAGYLQCECGPFP